MAWTTGSILGLGVTGYLASDKRNLVRADFPAADDANTTLLPDEREILQLASLAPSGHNAQPWFVQYLAPYHWVIGNDQTKWLPAVDPEQRETMLSIGAFLQNLESAAGALGYGCNWTLLATTNQAERVMEVKLAKDRSQPAFDVEKIKRRRTVRSGFQNDPLKKADLEALVNSDTEHLHYLPAASKEGQFVNEQTIEANRLQAYREPAQQELANWIRFSSKEARKQRDGLTTGGMEMAGGTGWFVRNFFDREDVMQSKFREQSIELVKGEVAAAAGWLLVSSKGALVGTLLETGRRMQRLFLKARKRNLAIHPMSQILEETSTRQSLATFIGGGEQTQFILRVGYVASYPPPVSLRCPVSWFLRLPA